MKKAKENNLVSLKDIFTGNLPRVKNLTDNKKTNYSINNLKEIFKDLMETITNSQTPEQKIMEAIHHLPPSKQLRTLEKLSMKIRKENSIRINKDVEITRNKYPKVR